MQPLFGQVVFVAGSQKYGWEDVLLAAKRWDDWATLEQEVRQGFACLNDSRYACRLNDYEVSCAGLS